MPIIKISMCSVKHKKEYDILQKDIMQFVAEYQDLENIKSNEVMVDFSYAINSNNNCFVYIEIWLYRNIERTEAVLEKFKKNLGRFIFERFQSQKIPLNSLEVLPIHMLDENLCFNIGEAIV